MFWVSTTVYKNIWVIANNSLGWKKKTTPSDANKEVTLNCIVNSKRDKMYLINWKLKQQ